MACAYNTLFYAPGTSDYAGPWHASSQISAGNVGTAVQPSFASRRQWHWAQPDSGRFSVPLWCVVSWYLWRLVWLVGQSHDFLCVFIFTIHEIFRVSGYRIHTYLPTFLWYLTDEASRKQKLPTIPTYCIVRYLMFAEVAARVVAGYQGPISSSKKNVPVSRLRERNGYVFFLICR